MESEITFEKAVEGIVKRNIPLFLTEGKVTSVDKVNNTCDVDRGDLPELLAVRLNSVLEAGENVVTIYPQKDSKVLCILVENSLTDAYVLDANNIEEIVINGGKNGGFTITPELVKQLDKLTARVDGIIDALKQGQTTAQDGGAVYKASVIALLEQINQKEDFSNIENEKVKH
jgi:hypothetical protein